METSFLYPNVSICSPKISDINGMRICQNIVRIAEIVLRQAGDDYQYIHDPDHRNRPHGTFWPTDKGWSNDPKDDPKNKQTTSKQAPTETTPEQIEENNYQTLSREFDKTKDPAIEAKLKSAISAYSYKNEKWIPHSHIVKNFFGNRTEVIKNPSPNEMKEIRDSQETYKDVAVIISVSGNIYAFQRENNLHDDIAKRLPIKEFTAITLSPGYAEVSPTTTQRMRETTEPLEMTMEAFPYLTPDKIKSSEYGVTDWSRQKKYSPLIKVGDYVPSLKSRFSYD